VIDDLPDEVLREKAKPMRSSVSAEAFGVHNKKQQFKAPAYPKSEAVKKKLKDRLEQAFMFSALNPDELDIVLGAMQEVKKKKGEQIIKEGEDGDNLYVVESGILSCTKVMVTIISFSHLLLLILQSK
jgi:cAMP-dependent protein kinase regulator